jgi:hypothetical protein
MTRPQAAANAPGGVREHLIRALEADLVGPFAPPSSSGPAAEVLHLPPSRWYLTGFLAPAAGRIPEEPSEDDMGAGSDKADLDGDDQEPAPKRSNLLPASMGLSVLLPPSGEARSDSVRARVSFADYRPQQVEEADGRRRLAWHREARDPIDIDVALDAAEIAVELPAQGGVWLRGRLELAVPRDDPGTRLDPGTRALALFVVNERKPAASGRADERFLFQVRLDLFHEPGFVPRPNRKGETSKDWDGKIADIQYRDRFELAVGHGVSVEVPTQEEGPVRHVHTTWLPRAEVRKVTTRKIEGAVTSMKTLSELEDGAAVRGACTQLLEAYDRWISQQAEIDPGSEERRDIRKRLVKDARTCRRRITEGVDLLVQDPQALDAFKLANRAMALVRRKKEDDPRWHLFQLAFLLMNLPSVSDSRHPQREMVELIFFPTGGGKTEAYLGVIAYLLVLRRLRGKERPDGGLGVAVLLRYTLRLLTLDQLSRAAGLICALEMIRRDRPDLGEVRFSIGLWVGRSATENTLARLAPKLSDFKQGNTKLSPVPLTHCPWCGKALLSQNMFLEPSVSKPTDAVVACGYGCEFSRAKNREGLPLVFIDEQVYRELPSFLVATVDKFAMLPWRGETGMLFGRALARQGRRFFGPLDAVPKAAEALPAGLVPPELIVQDELHLISGPLGSMVGLYETTIDELCRIPGAGGAKVIASTATVRRAQAQTRNLFKRNVKLFPPPGVDASETFFALEDRQAEGRFYVGVAAPGKAMKAILIRVYAALLAAARRCYDPSLPADQEADGYMTLAGYFNSLRELGGMRRLVEDEVRTRVRKAEDRRPESFTGRHPWFRNRDISGDPVELTSREPTAKISASKARLELPLTAKKSIDVLLASNMISVGVDIDRLGLMVVAGQPKTTSEYIQASSRVGRQPAWPGLVVTCLNHFKPRDRSHYERFTSYHESFYRFVEPTSLTPFSAPALDRALAANLVAMTRLLDPAMTPPKAMMDIKAHRALAERAAELVAERASHWIENEDERKRCKADVRSRGMNVLDAWERIVDVAVEGSATRSYSQYDREKADKALLRTALEDEEKLTSDEIKFKAPTSMRDVEAVSHLWLDFKHKIKS